MFKENGMQQNTEGFKSEQIFLVTERNYNQYLEFFNLPEEELKGKKILDVGSGFSSFVKDVNCKLNTFNTKAFGIDPIYSTMIKYSSFKDFKKLSSKQGLPIDFSYNPDLKEIKKNKTFKEQDGINQEFYEEFRNNLITKKNYFSGSFTDLPFKDNTFNLLLASNSIGRIENKEILMKSISECIRVVRSDGEVRISPSFIHFSEIKNTPYLLVNHHVYTNEEIDSGKIYNTILMNYFKKKENEGINLYGLYKYYIGDCSEGFGDPVIIIKKNNILPEWNKNSADKLELRKYNFNKSDNDYSISEEVIEKN